MAIATESHQIQTAADLLDLIERLGVPPARVLMNPLPGTATEEDLIEILDRADRRICELVDGTLVEKTMGVSESGYAILLASYIIAFLRDHRLGRVFGADAALRLFPGLVRVPDVCFIAWERLGERKAPLPDLAPDLAVEILSKSNTRREMERKLDDYRRSGVRLVWYVDPKTRSAKVYDAAGGVRELTEADELDGGDVLPGFRLRLADWFAEAEQWTPPKN